jgi:hypothetical protein
MRPTDYHKALLSKGTVLHLWCITASGLDLRNTIGQRRLVSKSRFLPPPLNSITFLMVTKSSGGLYKIVFSTEKVWIKMLRLILC